MLFGLKRSFLPDRTWRFNECVAIRYLTVEQVAERYATSKKAIHDKTRTNRIPYLKHAGMRRHLFNPEHLDAFDGGAELRVIERADGSRFVLPNAMESA